jgi:hypothetical protein
MSALTKFAEFGALFAGQQASEPPDRHLPDEPRGGRFPLSRGAYAVATSTHIPWNGTATITVSGRRLYASTNSR